MRTKIKQRVRIKQHLTYTINQANLRNLKQIDTTNEDGQQQTNKFQFATVNTRSIQQKKTSFLKP